MFIVKIYQGTEKDWFRLAERDCWMRDFVPETLAKSILLFSPKFIAPCID